MLPTPSSWPLPLTAAGRDALICAIGAVLVAITEPALWDTHVGARAGEGGGAARLAFCVRSKETERDSGEDRVKRAASTTRPTDVWIL